MMNKILSVVLLFCLFLTCGYKRPEKFIIDAVTNASRHNTLGVTYLQERCYYAAIQEFKIAISLNPNSQSSAVYYNNLGETYMKVGFPNLALDCFERAIKLYGLNFSYYQNLANCYSKMKMTSKMITKFIHSTNPLDKIMLGLLYIQNGDIRQGIIILDDFCISEPDLIITPGIKLYLKELTENNNS